MDRSGKKTAETHACPHHGAIPVADLGRSSYGDAMGVSVLSCHLGVCPDCLSPLHRSVLVAGDMVWDPAISESWMPMGERDIRKLASANPDAHAALQSIVIELSVDHPAIGNAPTGPSSPSV